MSEHPPSRSPIAELVQAHRSTFIRILQDLVRASEGGHANVQALVARRLQGAGAQVDSVSYSPGDVGVSFELGQPSDIEGDLEYVVGTLGEGDGGLLFFAHSDSERIDPTGWTRPLFDGLIDGGRLYGWGVGDDLVGVALLLSIAEANRHRPFPGSRRILLASTPSKRRAQAIIHAMDHGFIGDASVYLHPAESGAGLGEIKAIASGLLRFRLRVHGRQPDTTEPGHTVFAHRADDPVEKSTKILAALQRLADDRVQRVFYRPIHAVVGRSTNLHVSFIEAGHPDRLGKVPTFVDLGGSITFPPTEALDAVKTEFEDALHEAYMADAWLSEHPPELTWVLGIQGSAIDLASRVYRSTHEAITAATGSEPFVNPLHAGSDIRNPLLHKGIPTVGIGPLVGDLTVSGKTDEWVDVEDYLRAVEVVCRLAEEWSEA